MSEDNEDQQTSGTKDLTAEGAKKRIRSRQQQIDDAVSGAQSRQKDNQSTDSSQ